MTQATAKPQNAAAVKTSYILACIDGTDSSKWRPGNTLGGTKHANYSHVKQVDRQFNVQPKGLHIPYEDGPDMNGSGCEAKVAYVVSLITSFVKSERLKNASFRPHIAAQQCSMDTPKHDYEVVLFGHSRGAVICGDIARKLKSIDLGVYFAGLFDAVDRAYALQGGSSSNVLFTYHARRDPAAQRMTALPSRISFGNDMEDSLNNYEQAYFQTSHGGVGGSPALDYDALGLGDDFSCAGISKQRSRAQATAEMLRQSNPLAYALSGPRNLLATEIEKAWLKKGSAVSTMCVQQSQAAFDWMIAKARSHHLPV